MKNRMFKVLAMMSATVLAISTLTACGSQTQESTTPDAAQEAAPAEEAAPAAEEAAPAEEAAATEEAPTEEAAAELSGNISLSGSTSMEKLANALAESFMAKYPSVTVTPEFTGSSAGIEAVIAGSVDIGNSSRALKDSEKEQGAVENVVAIDGIAVVVDPANTVTGLTKDQLISIYKVRQETGVN